jgi:F0F1-type ATP synthase assembly protein I
MAGNDGRFPEWLRYSGSGLELAASVAGFALVGYWIDRHYGTNPWGLVAGLILGMIGGFYNLVKQSLQAAREAKASDESESGNSGRDIGG